MCADLLCSVLDFVYINYVFLLLSGGFKGYYNFNLFSTVIPGKNFVKWSNLENSKP